MTRETWRKFGNQALIWLLIVFAVAGALYFIGDEIPSRRAMVVMVVGGWILTWIIMRVKPDYYDRKRSKVPASVD